MVSERELKDIISQVLREMGTEGKIEEKIAEKVEERVAESDLVDITKIDFREVIDVKNPANEAELLKYKRKTPARVGIGRAGCRYRTNT
ncbi:MAG: ethanolamine ammonia-lyase, partial [Fusobacterium sp.]